MLQKSRYQKWFCELVSSFFNDLNLAWRAREGEVEEEASFSLGNREI